MIIDFRQADAPAHISADICIIGSGAAGISIAKALAGSSVSTCLIESGGLELDAETQALYEGDLTGHSYYPLNACRLRYFGGTTNHWEGWCAPLNDIDFQERDWISNSGWPIERDELTEFYDQAQKVCDLGRNAYLASDWASSYEELPPFDAEKLIQRLWHFSPPTRFGSKYLESLTGAGNVKVVLHANATKLVLDTETAKVSEVALRTLDGKNGTVRARTFVVACGGIENPRLLLVSNVERGGLGNENDLVGRYFMEHTDSVVGKIVDFNVPMIRELERHKAPNGTDLQMAFCISEKLQAERRILNCGGWIDLERKQDTGFDAGRSILTNLAHGKLPSDIDKKILRVIKDFDTFAGGASLSLQGRGYLWRMRPITGISMRVFGEQSPNPSSRVRLTNEKDSLGMPRLALNWNFLDADIQSVKETAVLLAEEFTRVGLGRIKLEDWVLDPEADWPNAMRGGFHHIGTTRMANSPREGVVNRDCKLHGVDNLYVAGSSVFPTSGYANPTLTIVAMSLRLAAHLKSQYV